jgi:hypothetical protein
MVRTAISELEQQIENVRREAFRRWIRNGHASRPGARIPIGTG